MPPHPMGEGGGGWARLVTLEMVGYITTGRIWRQENKRGGRGGVRAVVVDHQVVGIDLEKHARTINVCFLS